MCIYLLQYYSRRDHGLTLTQIIVITAIVIGLYSLIRGSAIMKTVLSHWHHRFEKTPFSPQEFYTGIKEALNAKGMSQLTFSNITYSQGGIFSPRREYLRIQYKEYIYDICAAPFASGFFVSWWLGETGNAYRDFFINLPVIGKFFNKRTKTFFELDTEMMFKEMVSLCVKETVETLTKTTGIRNISDAEWKEYTRSY